MATSNHTGNYNLSQYAAGDPVNFLTNYNGDMAAIDAAVKTAKDSADVKTPQTRTVAGLPLSADLTPLNGWSIYSRYNFKVCKIVPVCVISGLLSPGTPSVGTAITVLPSDYRPSVARQLALLSDAGTFVEIAVYPDGSISLIAAAPANVYYAINASYVL